MSRECNACETPMMEGYCIENGLEYYCTKECLLTEITWEEFMRLYDDGEGDSYWTEWDYNNCVVCGSEEEEGFFIRNEFHCMDPECLPETGARVYWKGMTEGNTQYFQINVPKVRWRETFLASSDQYKEFNGKRFTIMQDITSEELRDKEYGYARLYSIRFDDGTEIEALESEVENFTWAYQEYEVAFKLEHMTVNIKVSKEEHQPMGEVEIALIAVGHGMDAKMDLRDKPFTIATVERHLYPPEQNVPRETIQ